MVGGELTIRDFANTASKECWDWPTLYQIPQEVCCFARPRALLLLCEKQSQKSFAKSIKIVFLQSFFLSIMVKIIDLYENVIMTVDIPDGLNGNLLFSIRGLVQISEKSGYTLPLRVIV